MTNKRLFYFFIIVSAVLLFLWWRFPQHSFWEPLVLIVALSKDFINNQLSRKIDALEFSPALSQAHGYVNNFLEPVLLSLIKKQEGENLKVYIFKPSVLEDLSLNNIERSISQLKNQGYRIEESKFKVNASRSLYILQLSQQGGPVSYIDFPKTLLSLVTFIDYKIESKKNRFSSSDRTKFETKLISAFIDETIKILKSKRLDQYVTLVDNSLILEH